MTACTTITSPLGELRPCHRVIGADGSMRGYAGGIGRKVWLLTHEGAPQPPLAWPAGGLEPERHPR
jgi:6-O-methylguanine DNA methyltransferase, DNA binding domain